MRRLVLLALSMMLAACSNATSPLHYTPTVAIVTVPTATLGAVAVTDQRKEAPTRLATVMGGFGNPIKTLDTAKPVKDEVADAFTEGLRRRGMLGEGVQPFHLALTIRKFDADMIIGRTARINLTMSVLAADGHVVYEDAVADEESDMKFFETGIMANIDDLRVLCETVLNRTIDRMLDKPAFRQAVGAAAAGAPTS